ncbi:MAG: hypothetical protein D6682_06340 [Zetaproteobacteria bacterium]|nr:MAG: hypothetical protein D6682_06340 [Zetaproteobacteria bacterium]
MIAVAVAVLPAAAGVSAARADETLALKLGYANLNPAGTFASSNVASASRMDVDTLLGMGNSNGLTAEAVLQFGDHRLSLDLLPISFSGHGTLSQQVTYGGKSFPVGTAVDSSLKDTMYDIGYTYFFVNMDDLPSRLQLGVEFTVKINQVKGSMRGGGITAESSATAPIPTIGLRGRVALADFLGLVGRVGYLKVGGKGSYLDADGQLEFSPLPMVGIYGGYHYIKLKVDTSSSFTDLRFAGPYVGGFARF